MRYEDIQRLLDGETVYVLDNQGAIQIDLECNLFLALMVYEGKGDLFSMNLHETIEDAIEEIQSHL